MIITLKDGSKVATKLRSAISFVKLETPHGHQRWHLEYTCKKTGYLAQCPVRDLVEVRGGTIKE